MTPLTIVAIAFLLSLLLFGFAFWTPLYALPLAVLVLLALGGAEMVRRRGTSRELREFRAQARKASPRHVTEFTDRDRETIYEGHRR